MTSERGMYEYRFYQIIFINGMKIPNVNDSIVSKSNYTVYLAYVSNR